VPCESLVAWLRDGGQAVNADRQAAALGAETTVYAHLADSVFDDLARPPSRCARRRVPGSEIGGESGEPF